MMKVPIDPKLVDKRFVWYWLQSPVVREYIAKNAKGTSPTMKKVSQGIVSEIPFPTGLTVKEQERIVAELDILQAQVDTLKRAQAETAAELDALLPAILAKAFRGEL
jgi:type I restriction enzyme S subunit